VTLQVTANFSIAATTGTYQFSATAGAGTNGQPVNFNGLPSTGATVTIAFATATFTNTSTPSPSNTPTATPATVQISTGSPAPPNTNQLPGASNVPVLSVVLTNTGNTPVNFTSLTVSDNGTGAPSGISGINLLNNGSPIAGPVVFASSSATFSGLSVNIPASGSVTLQVAANFSNTAPGGTYQFSVTAGAGTNGQSVNISGLPSTGATVTIAFATSTPTNTYTPTSTYTPVGTPFPVIYPNPSDGTKPVNIHVATTVPSNITVQIFTAAFRKIQETSFNQQPVGMDIQVNLTDKFGSPLASGLYYVVVRVNETKRLIGKLHIIR
jgi:hypothetical protein